MKTLNQNATDIAFPLQDVVFPLIFIIIYAQKKEFPLSGTHQQKTRVYFRVFE